MCICKFILEVLVVLEELANRECLIGQVNTELVTVSRQRLHMSHHGDSLGGTVPKVIVLLRELFVSVLNLRDLILQSSDSTDVVPEGFLDLALEYTGALLLELGEGPHLCSLLVGD